ncbi:MAG TPA: nitrate reductase [Anaerolineae bacterium]|nr:nitrate reductase [Anaerolineae bacterium]
MGTDRVSNVVRSSRLLIIGLIIVIVLLGLAVVMMVIGTTAAEKSERDIRPNALARSLDDCVICHGNTTPGIVLQYGRSTMAAAEVACRDCHEVEEGYPGAVEHEGTFVLRQPTAARCQQCHEAEVDQFLQSRHALPAYVAYAGSQDLTPEQLLEYQAIPEGSYAPDKSRNALYALEGQDVTRFACEACHDIGKPSQDGSTGQCKKCHLRHMFTLEQARKPETCNYCHIGPDHPQWEIYHESPHGIAYATSGDIWNWEADAGTLTVDDFPAATCALCHFGGFGTTETTHDVGERLTWYLFAPISERRPSWEDNLTSMQSVCLQCHNENMISYFYNAADKATEAVNAWVVESNEIIAPLRDAGLLTAYPFDEPIDFLYFELWHHWGRTAKFGAWMQGPDYTQWHGAYEVLSDLAELREMVDTKLHEAQEEE